MFPVYRLNTYSFLHLGFFHALLNVLALTPLLERFEAEHGTLATLAMFTGREFDEHAPRLGSAIHDLTNCEDSPGYTPGSIVYTRGVACATAKYTRAWS